MAEVHKRQLTHCATVPRQSAREVFNPIAFRHVDIMKILARIRSGQLSRNEYAQIRSEQGIALIAVLWGLMLLSIIAVGISVEIRSTTSIARNRVENAAASAAADAGIQRAILDLLGTKRF